MQALFDYITKLQDTREILRHCPNAHVKLPTVDEIIEDLDRLKLYAEVEYEQD